MKQHRYERQGLLAVDPKAFWGLFFEPPKRENVSKNGVEVVGISGPLEHHAGFWCDSYDEILERVDAALAASSRTVVLRIDSPGGLVSGAFETARAMRAKADAAGKQLVAYVDGQACSAGYALACSAHRIVASETSILGSIGVIDTRVDVTAMDAQQGVRYSFITSGERKADGNPHQAYTAAELVEKQSIVDTIAGLFFALVSDLRGLDAAPMQARLYVGAAAKAQKLCDEVASFDNLLAQLASAEDPMTLKATKYEEARAALEEAAKGDDEEAAKAKRALAAMDDGGEDDDGGEEASAEGGDEPDGDEGEKDKDKEASASATTGKVAASTAADLASVVSDQGKEIAKLKAANEGSERQTLLASRPDLDAGLRKLLATKPLAEVKEILAAIPKPKTPKHAATAVVAPTRGAGQGEAPVPADPTDIDAQMDAAMGLSAPRGGVRIEGTTMHLGIMTREEAAKRAAKEGAK